MTLRAEAENPETPPERLRALVRRGLGARVARNPNTPPDLLLKLAARHFDEFTANPVLPLLLLENPGFCLQIPTATLRRLLRRTDVPQVFLQTLQRHPDQEVRDAARLHVQSQTEVEIEEQLARTVRTLRPSHGVLPELFHFDLVPAWLAEPLAGSPAPKLRDDTIAALGRSEAPPAKALHDLYRRAGAHAPRAGAPVQTSPDLTEAETAQLASGGAWARRVAAAHPATSGPVLTRLASSDSPAVRRVALRNPHLPVEALWANAGAPDASLRRAIASNTEAPEALLRQLAEDGAREVRRAVARNSATTVEALCRLANDPDPVLRRDLVSNPALPTEELRRHASDSDAGVRRRVASHRGTPLSCVEKLGEDESPKVREAAARRPDISDGLLARLCCDSEHEVAFRAQLNASLSRDAQSRFLFGAADLAEARRIIALPRQRRLPAPAEPRVPSRQPPRFRFPVRHLREPYDPSWNEKHREALDQATPGERLAELLVEKNRSILYAIAGNKNALPETLEAIYTHPLRSWWIYGSLARNPRTPEGILEKLARQPETDCRRNVVWNPQVPLRLLEELSTDEAHEVREAVARNERTPIPVLERMAQTTEEGILCELAANAQTPVAIIRRLAAGASPKRREHLALNKALPPEICAQLLHDPEYRVRWHLVKNPNLPAAELEIFLQDQEPIIRSEARRLCALAGKPVELSEEWCAASLAAALQQGKMSPETLARAQQDPDPAIRAALARHSALDGDWAKGLMEDANEQVVWGLFENPKCPAEFLERQIAALTGISNHTYHLLRSPALTEAHWQALVSHPKVEVRRSVVLSEVTPVQCLVAMAGDADRSVRNLSACNSNLPPPLIEAIIARGDPHALDNLVRHGKTPWEVILGIVRRQEQLEGFFEKRTRAAVVRDRRAAPEFLLEMLEREIAWHTAAKQRRRRRYRPTDYEREHHVLVELLRLTALPVSAFAALQNHSDLEVRRALLARPDLPVEWREAMRRQTLEFAWNGPALFARVAALVHPTAPPAILRKAVEQGRWVERYAVTQNPAITAELCAQLCQDSNLVVRRAARARQAAGSAQ